MQELIITKKRVAVLIGERGKTRKLLEKKLKVKLDISDEGDVILEGEELDAYLGERIIKAIGRGFTPETALSLIDEENTLEIVEIKGFSERSGLHLFRLGFSFLFDQLVDGRHITPFWLVPHW